MGGTTGVDLLLHKNIICDIKPQVWVAARDAKTDEESWIYSVTIHGPGYDTHNRAVWDKIQNCCIRNTVYNWIREFEANEYGRSMWMVLIQHYEETNSENKHVVLSIQAISLHPQPRLFYKNEHTFLFTKYTSCLQAEFVEITKYRNQVK